MAGLNAVTARVVPTVCLNSAQCSVRSALPAANAELEGSPRVYPGASLAPEALSASCARMARLRSLMSALARASSARLAIDVPVANSMPVPQGRLPFPGQHCALYAPTGLIRKPKA